ncbi:MAG: thiamine phosphate synthase [Deltaproteobacteria bacterium]
MNSAGRESAAAAKERRVGLAVNLAGLYAILDLRDDSAPGLESLATRLLEGGCRVMQLRAKNVSASLMLAHARTLQNLCRQANALFVVNDRLDIALAAGAGGIHLGQNDLPPEEARRLAPPDFVIGLSTHSAQEVAAAATRPVDYIGYGPIFPTRSKSDAAKPRGLSGLREAAGLSHLPIVAIGGIETDRAAEVFTAGASAVAMVGALERSASPRALTEALRKLAGDTAEK